MRRFLDNIESGRGSVRIGEGARRKSWLVLGLLSLGIFAFGQAALPAGGLSPTAQDLVKMAQAGVGESIMLTYVRTSSAPISLSADDVVALKAAGVPQSVITEAMNRNAASRNPLPLSGTGVAEDQLFRMRFGYIFYQGKIYPYQGGLNPYLQKMLQTDPAAQVDIRSFNRLKTTSRIMGWGGLSLVLGGAIYGNVSMNEGWYDNNVNAGIAFGAIGAGLIMAMIDVITNQAAYFSLYNGLSQYNRDLIAQSAGR